MTSELSPRVRELLEKRVDSFEKLELVLLLHHARERTMAVPALADKLRLSREVARRLVVELRAASLVDFTYGGMVQLLPSSQLDQVVLDEVIRAYGDDPIQIMRLLSEIALNRIRTLASHAFADAFVLGRKRRTGDG